MVFTFSLSADTSGIVRDVLRARHCVQYNAAVHEHCDLHWTTKQHSTVPLTDADVYIGYYNHFPHTRVITEKARLARSLTLMARMYGRQCYGFAPLTFILPRELQLFQQYVADHSRCTQWIVKPSCSSQGRSIALINTAREVDSASLLSGDGGESVVQRYIDSPDLIYGHKYDFRIYVALTSVRPLVAYRCERGLVRFSSRPYDSNDSDMFGHLTNSSINKHNKHCEVNDRIGRHWKWSLSQWLDYRRSNNASFNAPSFFEQLDSLIVLALLPLVNAVNTAADTNVRLFELFGLDVMVDTHGRLWLIEVNKSPDVTINNEIDRAVKVPMLNDLFTMVGIGEDPSSISGIGGSGESIPKVEECKEQLTIRSATANSIVSITRVRSRASSMKTAPSSASAVQSLSSARAVRRSSLQRASSVKSRSSLDGSRRAYASTAMSTQRSLPEQSGCWQPIYPFSADTLALNNQLTESQCGPVEKQSAALATYVKGCVTTIRQRTSTKR